jgi:hypothetical protein
MHNMICWRQCRHRVTMHVAHLDRIDDGIPVRRIYTEREITFTTSSSKCKRHMHSIQNKLVCLRSRRSDVGLRNHSREKRYKNQEVPSDHGQQSFGAAVGSRTRALTTVLSINHDGSRHGTKALKSHALWRTSAVQFSMLHWKTCGETERTGFQQPPALCAPGRAINKLRIYHI